MQFCCISNEKQQLNMCTMTQAKCVHASPVRCHLLLDLLHSFGLLFFLCCIANICISLVLLHTVGPAQSLIISLSLNGWRFFMPEPALNCF